MLHKISTRVPCEGSGQDPLKMTKAPNPNAPHKKRAVGVYGHGICSKCGSEFRLIKNGTIVAHKVGPPQDLYYLQIDARVHGQLTRLAELADEESGLFSRTLLEGAIKEILDALPKNPNSPSNVDYTDIKRRKQP